MVTRSHIIGYGYYLPEKVLTNDDLVALGMDTSDEWIQERTGIKQRHVAHPQQMTSDLAIEAAKGALKTAGLTIDSIDGIVLATTTPDLIMPATATRVQAELGMNHGFAFDIQAACSGFVYGLSIVDGLLKAGYAKRLLLIGAEMLVRLIGFEERSTGVLFGDGAGAVIVESYEGKGTNEDRGILSCHLHSDGRYRDLLRTVTGPSSPDPYQKNRCLMQGQEVFKLAIGALGNLTDEVFTHHNVKSSDIDWFIPHQANKRIIDHLARKLGLKDRTIVTVDKHANTSAASVPLAMITAIEAGKIKEGDLLLLEAMGGGFTWAGAMVRW